MMFAILYIMSTTIDAASTMPYQEKIAWLSLAGMMLAYIPYFTWVAVVQPSDQLPDLKTMKVFAAAALVHAATSIAGRIVLFMRSPDDARAPLDERDQAIAQRSISLAYWLLIVGMIQVGCVLPFISGGWPLINVAIATIVLAETVRYGIVIVSYRRWRG